MWNNFSMYEKQGETTFFWGGEGGDVEVKGGGGYHGVLQWEIVRLLFFPSVSMTSKWNFYFT